MAHSIAFPLISLDDIAIGGHEDLVRLPNTVRVLREERDIPQRATAFFASRPGERASPPRT